MNKIILNKLPVSIITYNDKELEQSLKSVNLHITRACNYRCRFCFAHFNQLSSKLDKNEWMSIIKLLADAGMQKVTFVGGEPTLVPFLPDLIRFAKSLGIITMLVSNGSKMNKDYFDNIADNLDWLGLSIDSGDERISKLLGRGNGDHVTQTLRVANLAKQYGIKLKINSVITQLNWQEDMSSLIERLDPVRWKVFQMLPLNGENNDNWELLISDEQFQSFLAKHKDLNPVGESNDLMTDSYVMVDPEGRFFNNSEGMLRHGQPILEVGLRKAFTNTNFRIEKFNSRDGGYFLEEPMYE